MEYLTVQETAEKWNLSDRMVQQFCTQGRIPGAQKFGRSWAIPADAEKPEDPRRAEKQAAPSQAELPPMGGLLDTALAKRSMPTQNRSVTYLILAVIQLGFVGWILMQSTINSMIPDAV